MNFLFASKLTYAIIFMPLLEDFEIFDNFDQTFYLDFERFAIPQKHTSNTELK